MECTVRKRSTDATETERSILRLPCNFGRESRVDDPQVESRRHRFLPALRAFAIRLAKRSDEGQTSKGCVGAWSDYRRGARGLDRDHGCLGLGRRRGLRVLYRGCAREDRRGDRRWTTHPASWPRLLRTPTARPPPLALTGANPHPPWWRQTASSLRLMFCPNRETKPQRRSRFGSSATADSRRRRSACPAAALRPSPA
jgi:hypothetical protein